MILPAGVGALVGLRMDTAHPSIESKRKEKAN